METLLEQHLTIQMNKSIVQMMLGNQFTEDLVLQHYLLQIIKHHPELHGTQQQWKQMRHYLHQLGQEVSTPYNLNMNRDTKPFLKQYDVYGNRVDQIITTQGWKHFRHLMQKYKMIEIVYANNSNNVSRIQQMIGLYIFSANSGMYSCPIAMTDGAAYTLRELKTQNQNGNANVLWNSQIQQFYDRLVCQNAISGQWMTEKDGGSDVANSLQTMATRHDESSCSLYGYKWFSSATDADLALLLARVPKGQQQLKMGKGNIELVMIDVNHNLSDRTNDKGRSKIQVVRLKDKMGTSQLPTGELVLDGAKGILLTHNGNGVKAISNMLNITRIHNSIAALSYVKKILALVYDYSAKRIIYGKPLIENPLYSQVVKQIDYTNRGCLLFLLNMIVHLQLIDNSYNPQSQSQLQQQYQLGLLRLLTPLLKLFSAKIAIKSVSECLECFGGLGYMEDSGIPQILRDVQVLSIWEGTTNTLAMDFVTAYFKNQKQSKHLISQYISTNIKSDSQLNNVLQQHVDKMFISLDTISANKQVINQQARNIGFNMSYLIICSLVNKYIAADDPDLYQFWIQMLQQNYVEIKQQIQKSTVVHSFYGKQQGRSKL